MNTLIKAARIKNTLVSTPKLKISTVVEIMIATTEMHNAMSNSIL